MHLGQKSYIAQGGCFIHLSLRPAACPRDVEINLNDGEAKALPHPGYIHHSH
jgi:hypothetical protein